MDFPEACLKCQRGQCELHCIFLEARLQAESLVKDQVAADAGKPLFQGTC